MDSRLRIPLTSHLVRTARETPFWVACGEEASPQAESELNCAGVEVLRLPLKNEGIHLTALLQELGQRQITSLLVEGGARVHGAFLEEGLADEFHFFFAPKILGDPQGVPMIWGGIRENMAESMPVHGIRVRRFGQDVMLSGRFHEKPF